MGSKIDNTTLEFPSTWHTQTYVTEIGGILQKRHPTSPVAHIGADHPKLKDSIKNVVLYSDIQDIPDSFRGVLLINDILGDLNDIWDFFRQIREKIHPENKCILIQTHYFWQLFLKKRDTQKSWLSHMDIENLLELNGLEIVSFEDRLMVPFQIPLVSRFLNHFLVRMPLFRKLAMIRVYFIRLKPTWEKSKTPPPSVSIVVPCRNEKGNILRCFQEIPLLGSRTEVIFVEGNSTDGTYEELLKENNNYKGPLQVQICKQLGKGKGDAVRVGFEKATGDILMILDSDLTVLPSDLHRFYLAIVEGAGDIIMGSRLVYPLEKESMRTLNIFGNKMFSLLFSWILERPVKDTLCGTKVLKKMHYEVIKNHRHFFGDFDPFGDYDLLFGAVLQNYKIVEIPVRYYPRSYGTTNISRFTHGWLLLKMCVFGFRRLKLGG